ncbi:MAG: hypothetical protein ABFR62_06170 [Bacteroidota bacterium]
MDTNPEKYGLSKRTKLELIDENTIAIVKLIKSRIIQKDAKKIIEMSEKIKSVKQNTGVALICTENICSKSKALLKDNGIEIVFREI